MGSSAVLAVRADLSMSGGVPMGVGLENWCCLIAMEVKAGGFTGGGVYDLVSLI